MTTMMPLRGEPITGCASVGIREKSSKCSPCASLLLFRDASPQQQEPRHLARRYRGSRDGSKEPSVLPGAHVVDAHGARGARGRWNVE